MILASEASQKKFDGNKTKTTVGPSLLSIKPLHKTKSQGGGPDPRSPLWIRACLQLVFLFIHTYDINQYIAYL